MRRAADELDWDLAELLVGPTAMAFVATDVGSAAKALTDFAKTQPLLVLKGGVMGGDVLDAGAVKELADLPTGPEIYSKLAGRHCWNGPRPCRRHSRNPSFPGLRAAGGDRRRSIRRRRRQRCERAGGR
ncbi:MAG: 50S ribosomal protein L10 [Candidatus Microthrix sp.]|nr:50S ribosomal protein L10 [Candidatus Microthrix sp.]